MKHYLKSKGGEIKYTVDMYCGHPKLKNNSTASIGCNGDCVHCKHGVAKLPLDDFYKIIQHAELDFIQ